MTSDYLILISKVGKQEYRDKYLEKRWKFKVRMPHLSIEIVLLLLEGDKLLVVGEAEASVESRSLQLIIRYR